MMRIEISKFNDIWLDNGLATFYELLNILIDEDDENALDCLEINQDKLIYSFSNEEEFIEQLSEIIKSKIDIMLVEAEDKQTGEKKEVKKEHILIQEGKKIGGKVAFKENIFDKTKTHDVIKNAFSYLNGDKYNCFFCNRPFKKNIKKIQQASYPFVTKIKSLSGIRSGENKSFPEYISEYCPQCYLLGILEWLDESIVYRSLPGDKSILILPNKNNLDELIKLKRVIAKQLENGKRWSNILIDFGKTETDNTPGRYTTFISFYENFLRKAEPEFDNDNWYIIEIPSGSVKNPKYFNILLEKKISRVLKILIRQDELYFYRVFIKEFYAFYTDLKKGIRDFETEKDLHEKLCRAFIEDDFKTFASLFVPRKGVKPGISKEAYKVLDKLLIYWRIEQMKIENKDEYLKNLSMAGTSLASLIEKKMGLFFKLEKAKTPNQFFKALQEITRRVMIEKNEKYTFYPSSIEKISQMILENYEQKDGKEFFETTKNILLIYTSLRANKENKNNKEKKQ